MSDSSSSTASVSESNTDATTSSGLWTGFLWGVLATIAMSLLMMVGMATGISPIPEPIPVAIVTGIFGANLPQPLIVILAAGSHLGYGGFWGAVLQRATATVTIGTGLGMGALLWLLMQVAVLPLLGWGAFGFAVTPTIAGATLVLHLVYGGVLGWGLS